MLYCFYVCFSLYFQNSIKKTSSIEDVEEFLKKNSKKRIKAIVESVIDGSTIKLLLLPEGHMITLYLSGIKVFFSFFRIDLYNVIDCDNLNWINHKTIFMNNSCLSLK